MDEPRAERPWMPDYGVNTPSWAPLPWTWAAERLVANRNFWVVTVSADGRPHALPVWGVWDESEHRFAFSCSPRARKARNLATNPSAVIMTDDTVECISIEGRAAAVTGDERREQWINRYLAKYQPITPDIDADFLRQHLMLEFTPDRAFAIIEREDEFANRATRWRFGS
jgi:hypothetical protein